MCLTWFCHNIKLVLNDAGNYFLLNQKPVTWLNFDKKMPEPHVLKQLWQKFRINRRHFCMCVIFDMHVSRHKYKLHCSFWAHCIFRSINLLLSPFFYVNVLAVDATLIWVEADGAMREVEARLQSSTSKDVTEIKALWLTIIGGTQGRNESANRNQAFQ